MSKMKLQVANAVQNFKKGVDKRNVKNTEAEIATFIDDQIELKEGEIKILNKEIKKYGEQNERDFIEGLAMFSEGNIKSVKGRESYAECYVLEGIGAMNRNKAFVEDKNTEITELTSEITDLKAFRKVLETIEVEVEEEV